MKAITLQDLLTADSNGYGYLGHEVRTIGFWATRASRLAPGMDAYDAVKAIDQRVVEAANRAKMPVEAFRAFLDSKLGRHLGDELSSIKDLAMVGPLVVKYLESYARICK